MKIGATSVSMPLLLAIGACSASPTSPTPSLGLTVQYFAGGSNSYGTAGALWFFQTTRVTPTDTAYAVLASMSTGAPASADTLRPEIDGFLIALVGPRFRGFPFSLNERLGVTGADTVGASVFAGSFRNTVDSGSVDITTLNADSVRTTVSFWASRYHVFGTVDIPRGT